jgi:hypothetical protein
MLVPRYWAEGKVMKRTEDRQVTIRRFGWSNVSPSEAQAMADARAGEALDEVFAGGDPIRREPKVAYNGADGIPIREEIVSEHGETVITRNSYGARCLNTADVFFADVDLADREPAWMTWLGVFLIGLGSFLVWRITGKAANATFTLIALLILVPWLMGRILRMVTKIQGGPEKQAMDRIHRFVANHPDWNLRVYETPAGFRLLQCMACWTRQARRSRRCSCNWEPTRSMR